jgi:hypothetical protein
VTLTRLAADVAAAATIQDSVAATVIATTSTNFFITCHMTRHSFCLRYSADPMVGI